MDNERIWRRGGAALLLSLAAACSGGTTPATAPLTNRQAARLLTQATFGPTRAEIDRLTGSSAASWVDAQLQLPPTLQLPRLRASNDPLARNNRMEIFWDTALHAPDQLRQRVALALGEIFVVSDASGALVDDASAVAWYQDLLARNAFGNYRTLLEDVTLSPAMGLYLNVLGNQKPDPVTGVRADENFAREVQQLFSVGLFELQANGDLKRDAAGHSIPTYGQRDVVDLARVLTGWSWAGSDFYNGPANNLLPMVAFEEQHDTGKKRIIGGVDLPAGATAAAELKLALDVLASHPNVGPFLGRQLIQRLVTSNPAPAYVGRVSAAWADDGHGVRGNLAAVVRAVLLDPEARADAAALAPRFGKRREPLLVVTQLWRALGAASRSGRYPYWNPESDLGQAPLSAPSVFNFFSPRYAPPGPILQAGLVAPELQRVNASSVVALHNALESLITGHAAGSAGLTDTDVALDFAPLRPLATAADPAGLVSALDLLLLSGGMAQPMRDLLGRHLATIEAGDGTDRIEDALLLTLTSPTYLLQQ